MFYRKTIRISPMEEGERQFAYSAADASAILLGSSAFQEDPIEARAKLLELRNGGADDEVLLETFASNASLEQFATLIRDHHPIIERWNDSHVRFELYKSAERYASIGRETLAGGKLGIIEVNADQQRFITQRIGALTKFQAQLTEQIHPTPSTYRI